MCEYATNYPIYDWDKNKGYGTKKHFCDKKVWSFTIAQKKVFLKT